jgi:hypothetical protein
MVQPTRSKINVYTVGIAIAIMLGLCLMGVALIATTASGPGRGNPVADDVEPATAGLNQAVRDGKFEFTVTKIDCGKTQVGSQYSLQKAQGQYCLVSITVKNIGDKAQMFDSSNQHAYNATGAKYDTDGLAAIYLDGDSRSFLEDINPGNTVNGVVVFDIPKGASIVALELHDSAFSGGVTVNAK